MSVAPLPLASPFGSGLRLTPYAVARPALSSHVRPAVVLAEAETRALFDALAAQDVSAGGRFSSGPLGAQLWDRPFDGPEGTAGSAVHLGSVDWTTDTPVRGYLTLYRAIVTEAGAAAGALPVDVLRAVVELVGVGVADTQLTPPAPPPRDPFRAGNRLAS